MPGQRADGIHVANFGVDRALWNAALEKARGEGRSLSDVLRQFLREYAGPRESGEGS
jgi:hypothetical protein